MIDPIRTLTDPSAPVRLHALDRPADLQDILIRLCDAMRLVISDAELMRTIVTRDMDGDLERARRRAISRAVELYESAGRTQDIVEELSRAMRSAGRL